MVEKRKYEYVKFEPMTYEKNSIDLFLLGLLQMEKVANEAQQPVDERVAWGQWLMSTCLRVSSAYFQQYQRDIFEATLRWIPREPVVQGTPLPGPSALLHPQHHTTQQVFTQHIRPQPLEQQPQQIQQPSSLQMLGGNQHQMNQQQQEQQQHQAVMGWMTPAPQDTPAVVSIGAMSSPAYLSYSCNCQILFANKILLLQYEVLLIIVAFRNVSFVYFQMTTMPTPTQAPRSSSAPVATTTSLIENAFSASDFIDMPREREEQPL